MSRRLAIQAAAYALLSIIVGVAGGIIWWQVATLPGYLVGEDRKAATSERGLTEVVSADAWFVVLGLIFGVGLGIIAWRWFGSLGWPSVPIALVAAVCAALICWWVGQQLGPGPFEARLAAAKPGDIVPIELKLRAKAALAVWAFGAVAPILVRSSLGKDAEDPTPIGRRVAS